MKKCNQFIISIMLSLVIMLSPLEVFASNNDDNYCYPMTCSITKASIDYLNEIYIKKYPRLGTGYLYGSDEEKVILKKMTNKIVANANSDKEKMDAITKWVKKNIEYHSIYENTYMYPIDVFYHREGNCVGSSQLIRHMARAINIPAVICDGTRGDMKECIKLGTREMDHEWVMAYIDNKWLLYDPLFDEYGVSDQDYISRWYFTDHIEGISPYYNGIDYQYVNYGDSIFYIDGRFMHYKDGVPASQIYGTGAEGGTSTNGCISYLAKTFYDRDNDHYGNDGFRYLENDDRRYEMINDQCHSNGWMSYGNALYYAKENGILLANQIVKKDGQNYFLAYDGSAFMIESSTDEFETTEGYITIHKNIDKIKLIPTFVEGEISEGRIIEWENYSPDIVRVDNEGNITPIGEGLATMLVMSKSPDDLTTHFYASYVQVYVTKNGYREYSYNNTHSGTKIAQVEPTCSSYGVKAYYKCECGKFYEDEACTKEIEGIDAWLADENGGKIAAKGHTVVVDKAVAATSTKRGLTEGSHCAVCNEVLTAQVPTTYTKVGNVYTTSKTTVTYAAPAKTTAKTIEVPATVKVNGKTYKVTSVEAGAFKNCKKLTTVKIGSNVKTIGDAAFSGCKNLKTVTIGSNVTAIGENAFAGCTKLKTVKLNSKLKTIGKNAFSKCTSLAEIVIPDKVTAIADSAFNGCTKLKAVTIGKSVKTIGAKAFNGCKNLTSIKILSTKITKISADAFKGISSKATITAPSKKVTSYKKLIKASGAPSKVSVTKN